jgi:hypothetical protein
MLRALSALLCLVVVGCTGTPRPPDGSWVICGRDGQPLTDVPLVTLMGTGEDDLDCTLHADGAHGSRQGHLSTTLRRDGFDSWTSDPMEVTDAIQVPVFEGGRLSGGHRPMVGPLLTIVFDLGVETSEAELRVATEMDGVLRFPIRRQRY